VVEFFALVAEEHFLLDILAADLRYALRIFRRSPGSTATAVVSLAVGIAAATGLFCIVNATLPNPFPFADINRIVRLDMMDLRTPRERFFITFPYHGGSHAAVGVSRTSSARRFIARSRAVFPNVSGRRAPQLRGINRSRSTPRAVSQSTTRLARCKDSVSASSSVPSANALTRTRSPRFEDVAPAIAPVDELWKREYGSIASAIGIEQRHQRRLRRIRQRSQENGVHDGEDCGRRTHAKRDGQGHHHREAGSLGRRA
jgi:hypothetical protein